MKMMNVGYESSEEILPPSPEYNVTDNNKVELFDSSRPLNQEGFLDQRIPALGATKKKNLKRKVSRPSSNQSS